LVSVGKIWAAILFLLIMLCAHPLNAAELELFAGAASKPATEELVKLFEAETDHEVRVFFGGSGSVLSQMKIAKRGDLYFPGSPDFMSRAKQDGLIVTDTEKIIAYLIPAINVRRGNPEGIKTLKDLARPGVRVAIGNPRSVCLGLYAVEIFEHAKMTAEVKPRIIGYTESCEKLANLLTLNGADAILGWRVFESWNPEKMETILLQPDQIPRISYMPIAVSSLSKNVEVAKQFIDFACSKKGKKIFEKWGYLTREEDARKYAPNAVIGGDYVLPEGW
jgi:molybdate transport system substrate-binding protein